MAHVLASCILHMPGAVMIIRKGGVFQPPAPVRLSGQHLRNGGLQFVVFCRHRHSRSSRGLAERRALWQSPEAAAALIHTPRQVPSSSDEERVEVGGRRRGIVQRSEMTALGVAAHTWCRPLSVRRQRQLTGSTHTNRRQRWWRHLAATSPPTAVTTKNAALCAALFAGPSRDPLALGTSSPIEL